MYIILKHRTSLQSQMTKSVEKNPFIIWQLFHLIVISEGVGIIKSDIFFLSSLDWGRVVDSKMLLTDRVTRLVEFSPWGLLLLLG
jgi:hypothetical protein